MLNWLFKRWIKPPTQEQLRVAKKLGIKSAPEMSQKTLAVVIAQAEKKRAVGR